MNINFETIAGWIVSGLFGLVGWVIKLIRDEIKEIKMRVQKAHEEVDDFKLYSAKTYTTKDDVRAVENNIMSVLRRIEDKLDKKADKK